MRQVSPAVHLGNDSRMSERAVVNPAVGRWICNSEVVKVVEFLGGSRSRKEEIFGELGVVREGKRAENDTIPFSRLEPRLLGGKSFCCT